MTSRLIKNNSQSKKDFLWFLEKIASMKTCNLKIPDTLLFKSGKPVLFVYYISNKIHCTNKIKFHEIISFFMKNITKRKSLMKSALKAKTLLNDTNNDFNTKEIAVARLIDGSLKLLENKGLVNILLEKSPCIEWERILSIQSLIKTQSGPTKVQTYIYNIKTKDNSLIKSQIEPIHNFFLSKSISLLSFSLSFSIDDHEDCWLHHLEDLLIEKLEKKINTSKLIPVNMSPELRLKFLEGLDYHSQKPKSKKYAEFLETMTNHYKKIKEKLFIDDFLSTKFHFDVPDKNLPFIPKKKIIDSRASDMFITDPRNTDRTVRRLSLFQSNDFKSIRSPRLKGRKLFD
jgi:hypothetical protein